MDERAINTGGVSQDMFSSFWEHAYIAAFDGGNLLVHTVHPGTDMAKLPVLGDHNVPWITFLQLSSHLVGINFPSLLLSCLVLRYLGTVARCHYHGFFC